MAGFGGHAVVAVDVRPERLELAKRFGADLVLHPRELDVAASVKELTRGEGADGYRLFDAQTPGKGVFLFE